MRNLTTRSAWQLVLASLWCATPAWADQAPYAGWETRQIKGLSAEQIDDLRAGRGMAMALSAELNGYPGPRHVLDFSDALGLSAEQRADAKRLFHEMEAQAWPWASR